MQGTVHTVQAHLSVSLFPSVQHIEHIVSSLKLHETKLFFFGRLCVCMCGCRDDMRTRQDQSSTLCTDFVIQTAEHSGR